jgi:hypothetical protein
MALFTFEKEGEKDLGRSRVQSHALRNKFFRNEKISKTFGNLC